MDVAGPPEPARIGPHPTGNVGTMVPPPDHAARRHQGLALAPPDAPAPPAAGPAEGPATAAAPPSDRHGGFLWLLIALVGFLVGQVAGYLLALAAAALTHHSVSAVATLAAPPEWYVVSSLVGVWIGFLGAPLVASVVAGTRHPVADLGIRVRPIDLCGIPIGVAAQYVIWLLYWPFRHDLHNYNAPVTKLTGASHGGGYVLIAVLAVVVAPFAEELFFRGLLLRALVRLTAPLDPRRHAARLAGLVGAVVADGLVFALAHAEVQQFAGLALFGMLLAVLSYRTGRQGMNVMAHGAFNLVAVAWAATVLH